MGKIYIVQTRSLSGLKKKMFKRGDEVTAENFPEGSLPSLVSGGFLSEKGESVEEVVEETTNDEVEKVEDYTKAELKAKLDELGVEYAAKATKDTLLELYQASK